MYYAPILFTALGQNHHMSLILAGMINIDQLVGAIPTILFLDKIGRRKLAIGGGIAMGIPHAILAGLVGKFNDSWTENPGPAWFAVALVYIYVLCYAGQSFASNPTQTHFCFAPRSSETCDDHMLTSEQFPTVLSDGRCPRKCSRAQSVLKVLVLPLQRTGWPISSSV